jgi:hypothetical protein
MTPTEIFLLQLPLGYVPWLLVCAAYVWPRLWSMERVAAIRAIAAVHSFRFFGLVFILPGVVGPSLTPEFASYAAYGDFITGVLAMLALLTFRIRPLFWTFAIAFNVVGAADILVDYFHGASLAIPPGQLGSAYGIVMIYVPLLFITHATVLLLVLRPARRDRTASRALVGVEQ